MSKGVLIAMSGGVDSSVTAWLMQQQGFSCIGAMMKLYEGEDGSSGCCSLDDANDARAVAHRIGMPFYVFNFKDEFEKQVMARFVRAYQAGYTPNPCIDCNRYMKFDRFLDRALSIGMTHIATGHYAQSVYDAASGRYLLKKGVDPAKDQSYVLYAMTQKQLAHTLFPLGGMRKEEVRKIAEQQGFINAHKRDSQDICFVPDGKYAEFIAEQTGAKSPKGDFVDLKGNRLGEHKGIIHYTVGQRKGLGIASASPLYVCRIQPDSNTVVLSGQEALFSRTLTARDINLIAMARLDAPLRVQAKIRYQHPGAAATLTQIDEDTLHIAFDQPQRAITGGQAVVLYDGDLVIGGGTIVGGE